MKVILIQDSPNLGHRGELREVASGYARNFLIPKGIAVEATSGVLKTFEANKEILERKYAKEEKAAQEVAGRLQGKVFTVKAKAGDAGKLFGSVTTADLSALLGNAGFIIDKKKIELPDHIKEVGEYEIQVKLHPEVRALVKLVVEAEGKAGETKAAETKVKEVAAAPAAEAEVAAETEAASAPAAVAEAEDVAAAEESEETVAQAAEAAEIQEGADDAPAQEAEDSAKE